MKHLIYAFIICLLATGCEKYESQQAQKSTLSKKVLSGPETILKDNLLKAARILTDIIEDDAVKNELTIISEENRSFYNLTFKDLFAEAKGTGDLFKVLNERFLSECSSAESKGGMPDLAAYLSDNGCYIYCPYPLSFYPKGTSSFTVAAHPIDNDIEGTGYRYENKKVIEAKVNENYADKYPVLLIMPKDEDKEDRAGIVNQDLSQAKGEIYEVRIGKVRCADFCGGLFEGELELRIVRGYPEYNLTTGGISGTFSNVIPITYPRDYAKAAINNWTVHSEGGWYSTFLIWDSNWKTSKTQQCILVYEYDHVKESTVSATVGYKKDDLTPSTTVSVKATYSGDFLGISEWDRDWFYATNKRPGIYDEVKDGWTVRKTCPELKMTTPATTIYY